MCTGACGPIARGGPYRGVALPQARLHDDEGHTRRRSTFPRPRAWHGAEQRLAGDHYLLTYLLTYSLTHSLTYVLTYLLTYLLT